MKNTKGDGSLPQIINNGIVEKLVAVGTHIGDINIKIDKPYSELSELSTDKIKEQFQQASHILSDYQNFFEGLPDSHFDRKETEELFQWVESPVIGEVKPIAMVVGDAGNGKSVILKDLWKKLDEAEIPVLGIKADRYYVESIKELEERLGVDDKLEAMVRKLQKERGNVVILIDQIDALSLSLSTNRNYITVYKQIVKTLSSIVGVKIVISVRTYDLEYDPELNFFDEKSRLKSYQNQKTFKVNTLDKSQVESVLQQLKVDNKEVSDKLIQLLQTPLHLNVFCKIYTPSVQLRTIRTLQDLYFELWNQKVLNIPNPSTVNKENVIHLLYRIVDGVEISVPEISFRDKYTQELEYLKSEGLIKAKGGSIQFFHQTFFDFVFSKKFVETNNSVWKFLKKHKQGLLVRAKLKMIVNYLRDYDETQYLRISKKLLKNEKVLFHIKYLLLTLLAYRNHPTTKELKFTKSVIFKDSELKNIFLESSTASGWLQWFINVGLLDELLFSKDYSSKKLKDKIELNTSEEERNLWFALLFRRFPKEQPIILEYISSLPEFEGKSNLIFKLLYHVTNWDSKIAKELFEKTAGESQNDEFGYLKILEDAASCDFDWAMGMYSPRVIETFNEIERDFKGDFSFSHDDIRLMKKMFELNPEKSFDAFFEILKVLIEKTRLESQNEENQFYQDYAFWLYTFNKVQSIYNYYDIYRQLIIQIRVHAKSKKERFHLFLQQNQHSNSITILNLIATGFIANPKDFISEIFEFIRTLANKNLFKWEGKLQFFIRQLLTLTYASFSSEQQEHLNKIILSIDSKFEPHTYQTEDGKKRMGKTYGQLQYLFLNSLPESERKKYPTINKKYNELKRKEHFEKIEDKEPNSIGSVRRVPAPLPQTAYEKMSFEQWEKSFEKYNDDFKRDPFSDEGSKLEHSRAFEEIVKKYPEKFFPFLEKIIAENRVSITYIIFGLEGLKNGEYQVEPFLDLFEKIIRTPLDDLSIRYMVNFSSYIIEAKKCSQKVLEFLIENALHHPDPKDDDIPYSENINFIQNPLSYGGNSVRGAAARRLTHIFFDKKYEDMIFDALEKVVNDKLLKVRICILPELAYLNHLNIERVLKLFLKITQSDEIPLLSYALIPSQFLGNYNFKALIPFFQKTIEIDEIKGNAANHLAHHWLNGKEGSFELLKKALLNSEEARSNMPEIAATNLYLKDGTLDPKSEQLFEWSLNDESEVALDGYLMAFHRLEVRDFKNIYHLIKKYAKSKVGARHHYSYYEFLVKCSSTYPKGCIELLTYRNDYDTRKERRSGFHDNEPIKVVMGAYNALDSSTKGDREYIEKAMKIFDEMLKSNRLRSHAQKVLNEIEI